MNRIVIIGNGFDIAHGLNTRYSNFINWYWEGVYNFLCTLNANSYKDDICSIDLNRNCKWDKFLKDNIGFKDYKPSEFYKFAQNSDDIKISIITLFEAICKSKDIQKWVDIENIYYNQLNNIKNSHDEVKKLNKELDIIRELLVEYLSKEIIVNDGIKNDNIAEKILEPINPRDIMVSDRNYIDEHFYYWINRDKGEMVRKLSLYDKVGFSIPFEIEDFQKNIRLWYLIIST